ncbi:MAG: hypothetical protein AMJ90_02505 [candidate division Zixibacteria bacterium SM23_73_2]|nr:MAG: hypothetical protein AMJ90_02505 [candidate division Zixibacteria bacterium SM23_73_2]
MARKVLVLSLVFLMIFSVSLWATKHAPLPNPPLADGSGYVLDYLITAPPPGAFRGTIESPYDHVIGYVYYDYQHNSTIPPMICNDYQATSGENGIHSTYMTTVLPEMTSNRFMYEAYKAPGGAWTTAASYTHGGKRAGYGHFAIFSDSREVAIFHYVNPGPDPAERRATLMVERTAPGFDDKKEFDIPDSCEGVDPEEFWQEGGMWPHGNVDGSNRIHVLIKTGTGSGTGGLGYIRCTPNGDYSLLTCAAPGITPRVLDGGWIDPDSDFIAEVDISEPTAYIVATDPGSNKVALVWQKWTETWPVPDDTSYQRTAGEIWYVESTNGGDDWVAGSSFDDFIDRDPYDSDNNCTKWRQGRDLYRAEMELAACYDVSGNLHVFFSGFKWDEPEDDYDVDDVKLFHWSKATEKICGSDTIRVQPIAGANWESEPGVFNLTLTKISGGVGIIPSLNQDYVYCLWTQFDSGLVSAAGYGVGELYVSVSTTHGATWDAPRNITNTPDNGCVADECDSDHWASLATRVDSFLHIAYVNDRDAGGIPMDEGTWTNSPYLYYKYPVWTITPLPRIDWMPAGFEMPNAIAVPNNGTVEDKEIVISGIGTTTLNVTGITGPAWITNITPSSFSILEGGCPNRVTFDINASAYSEEMLVGNINVVSDDGVGNNNINIPIHVVVSDVYVEPAFAAFYNNSFYLTESNVSNIGHQIDSASMTFDPAIMPDPDFGPVFDGSVIIGSDALAGSTHVARYLFNERYMLAETEMKAVNAGGVKTKIAKARCNPLDPLPPFHWKWWWLTVEYYDKIFYSGTINSMERFIKKWHVKIYKNPKPPWWDVSDVSTTNPAALAGIAVDIDCPSDTGNALNTPGFDESLNLLYQQGFGAGSEPNLFAGVAWHDPDDVDPINALITANDIYIYPNEGYDTDSLWSLMTNYSGFAVVDTSISRIADYNQVITGKQIAADLAVTDTIEMQFLIVASATGLDNLKNYVRAFKCGNANRDAAGAINLSDVIDMANDYFGTGAETFRFLADVNGDCALNLTDVINLAKYYFGKPIVIHCDCQEKWED